MINKGHYNEAYCMVSIKWPWTLVAITTGKKSTLKLIITFLFPCFRCFNKLISTAFFSY